MHAHSMHYVCKRHALCIHIEFPKVLYVLSMQYALLIQYVLSNLYALSILYALSVLYALIILYAMMMFYDLRIHYAQSMLYALRMLYALNRLFVFFKLSQLHMNNIGSTIAVRMACKANRDRPTGHVCCSRWFGQVCAAQDVEVRCVLIKMVW